jgi:hypothetical protein
MPEQRRHESDDLGDYEVRDGSDTLDGGPGDDPLDRGLVAPVRWSTGMRYGSTAEEQESGESLDQLLAEEEPDDGVDLDDDRPSEDDWDENATDDDIARFVFDEGPDPRSGRLIAEDEGAHRVDEADLVAYDAGADGGGATAEEAAVHVVAEETGPPSAAEPG